MDINIAVAGSCSSKVWHNKVITWTEFVQKLRNPHRTKETVEEFKNMDSESKGKIKNCIGGFVGGRLVSDGPRNKSTLKSRRLLTLDIDYCNYDIWSKIQAMGVVSCVYSTHSHSADNIRLRVIIPLDRDVNPQEYQAISRMVASKIDIEIFDITTHEPERLMFWPSISIDGEYYFKLSEGEILKADDILNEYTFGWQDMSSWPISSRERHKINADIKKQQDPTTKDGLIGAFCRTYTITEAIAEFIPDIYVPGKDETRYTYAEGSTSGGIVVYDDKFSYSHHGTDPASNILCNAFDLIRIQKFSELDNGVRKNTKTENLPSFKKMIELCSKDKKVLVTINKDSMVAAQGEFGEVIDESSLEWLELLKYTNKGMIAKSIDNALIIIQNDPQLKGKIYFDLFEGVPKKANRMPWNAERFSPEWLDSDDDGLTWYISKYYMEVTKPIVTTALSVALLNNEIHPIRDYIKSHTWDGVERIEQLFMDYLGANDTHYNRMVTKKALVAAVKRVFEPGCKYEELPILVSPEQGIGKSTILNKLGGLWYSDSLSFNVIKGETKKAIEQTIGAWIIELSELKGLSSKDSDTYKSFMSGTVDRSRMAYSKRVCKFERQFIVFGTTNNEEFLSDRTGNRRYLPIRVGINKPTKNVFRITQNEINQIWAEAHFYYKEGYKTYLNKEENKLAAEQQELYMYSDDDELEFEEYLTKPISKDWYNLPLNNRLSYLYPQDEFLGNDEVIKSKEVETRNKICIKVVYDEFIQKVRPNQYINGLTREVKNDIKNMLIKAGWHKYDKNKGQLKFGLYGLKTAYIKK